MTSGQSKFGNIVSLAIFDNVNVNSAKFTPTVNARYEDSELYPTDVASRRRKGPIDGPKVKQSVMAL